MKSSNPDIAVSVITPSHNTALFIEETIQSVLNQDFKDWELIIIDDSSSDDSLERIKKFEDSRIRLIEFKENKGAAVARNAGIEVARGRWIAFLDSDDVWLPHKLSTQLAFMQKHEYAFSYSAYAKINEAGQKIRELHVPPKVNYTDLLKTCSIGCLTAVYDTKVLGKVYMPLIEKRQDYGLWLKLLKQTTYAYGMQEILAAYRVRSRSISSNKWKAAQYQWRVYRELEKLSWFAAVRCMISYSVYGVINTYFK